MAYREEGRPVMTQTEMQQRAQERAVGMRTWALTDGRTYVVCSRSQDGFYTVQTTNGNIDYCECEGWHFRHLCKHSEAVSKRLRRERRAA